MPLSRLLSYRKTLAFRLTLWYAGVFAVSSCIAFLMLYALMTSVFRDRTDQDLLGQAREFSATLASRGLEAAKSLAMIEAQAAGVKKVFFRLLSSRGEVFSSSNMSYWQDIDIRQEAIRELLRERKTVFETVTIPNRKDKVRVLHSLVGTGVILQIGQSMEADSRFIDAFKNIFLVTMVLLLGLAAGVGWFMARRAVSGVEKLNHEDIDLARLVRDACELLEPVAEDKGLSLTCDTPQTCALVGDRRMIQRILSNLLDNALKYTPAGGAVKISFLEKRGQEVVVAVQDTGIGIPPNDLPHIFERFYRCDQSRSEPGTGLGLSLARALARAHNGDITVTSTLGQGSTFTLILPRNKGT